MVAVKSDDSRWRKLVASLVHAKERVAKVGVFSGEQDGVSLAEIATVHEFGSPANDIPERSFLRSTLATKSRELTKVCERAASAVVNKAMPIDQALGLIGTWAAAAVKRTITSGGIVPPLKPATIAAKGSSKPLVDTGQLVNAITFVVGDAEG